MTYRQTFKGTLRYPDERALEAAFDACAQVDALTMQVGDAGFQLEGLALKLSDDAMAPASSYDKTAAAVRALARFAAGGTVRCAFHGDGVERETIAAGGEPAPSGERHRGWELVFAARAGDAGALEQLVRAGAKAPAGRDPLKIVSALGAVDAVRVLIAGGFRSAEAVGVAKTAEIARLLVGAGNPPGAEALHDALYEGNGELAIFLLEHGARCEGEPLRLGLMRACLAGQRAAVQRMRELNPGVDDILKLDEVTAITLRGGNIGMFDDLMALGAALPERYPANAAEDAPAAFVDHIMRRPDAVAQCGDSSDGGDAMCRAALHGRLDVVQVLARHGVPIHPATPGETSPLKMAASGSRMHEECLDVIRWLVEQGAPADARNAAGQRVDERASAKAKALLRALRGRSS